MMNERMIFMFCGLAMLASGANAAAAPEFTAAITQASLDIIFYATALVTIAAISVPLFIAVKYVKMIRDAA